MVAPGERHRVKVAKEMHFIDRNMSFSFSFASKLAHFAFNVDEESSGLNNQVGRHDGVASLKDLNKAGYSLSKRLRVCEEADTQRR
jgi:hypothetical protein